MNSTSLTDRLLLANLPDEEMANGQRLVRALSLVEEKLRGELDRFKERFVVQEEAGLVGATS